MKKIISLCLSVLMIASALVGCAPAADQLDPAITVASSDASAMAEWLDERLETIPDKVIVGIGSNEKYGVDMAGFDDSGYIARAIGGDVLLFGKTEDGLDRAVREYAKAADLGATAELDTVFGEGEWIEKLTVGGHDISEFTVVCEETEYTVPKDYGKTVGNAAYAADELVRLIEKATGVTLKQSTKDVSTPMIKIGYIADGSLGENGFEYYVKDGDLYINGAGDANGCANGVYHFLQYQCGWGGLMFGDSIIGEAELVEIGDDLKVSVDPMFDYLKQYTAYLSGSHLKYQNDRTATGYNGIVREASHGMYANEWSGLDKNNLQWFQICHTDDSVYANVADRVYSYLLEKETAGEDMTYVDISQGDNFGYCKCSGCMKVYREEGNVHSGAVVRFANRLALELDTLGFADVGVLIFAYHASNIPCKTALNESVFITVCNDGSCANHKFDGSDCTNYSHDMAGKLGEGVRLNNADYCEWLRGWRELSDNVYVWHYLMDQNLGQYTGFDYIYDDIMLFYEIGIKGLFIEGETAGLGMGRVRHQLINLLNYNPDVTEEEYNILRDEVLRREYGDGYDFVLDYIGIWRETESTTGCWNCWMGDLLCTNSYDQDIYRDRADEMRALLEKALAQANSLRQENNVKRLLMEVLYRQCSLEYFGAEYYEDTEQLEELSAQYQLFVQYLEDNGFTLTSLPKRGGKNSRWTLSATIEEAAANEWAEFKDTLLDKNRPYTYEHVIVIGVDGAGNAWQNADTYYMDEIFANGATTNYCVCECPTISGQNWSSLMTGVSCTVHGRNNDNMASDPYESEEYPTFFKLVRDAHPDATLASIVNWNPINNGLVENGIGVMKDKGISDSEVRDKVIDCILNEKPELLFVQFDEVDAVGHRSGSISDSYLDQLRVTDEYIGQIYRAVEEAGIADKTLFIVTADHGHTRGGGHGGTSEYEKYVFFGAAGKSVLPTDDLQMNIRDIPTIVAHALGVEPWENWDAYLPQGLFADDPEPEARPFNSTADHKTSATPAEGTDGYIGNYIDMDKLHTAIFFDGSTEDLTGNENTKEVGTFSYDDGYYGNAAIITDGAYLSLPALKLGTGSFSIGAWMKKEDIDVAAALYSNKALSNSTAKGIAMNVSLNMEVNLSDGQVSNTFSNDIPVDFQLENWIHTMVVVDKDAGCVRYYNNFQLVGEHVLDEALKEASFDSGRPFNIGCDGTGESSIDYSLVDDFLLFDDALTEAEIQSLCGYYFK